MNLRRLLVPLLLAAIGYAALAYLIPRFDASAKWDYDLDRATAITHARRAAARYGLDAARWTARVTAERQNQIAYYLSRRGRRAETSLLSPVKTSVLLLEPDGQGRKLRVELTTSGQMIGFVYREPAPASATNVPVELTRQAAESALNRLVGDDAARQFSLVSEADQGAEGIRFTWEQMFPGEEDLKLRVTSLVRGQTVRELTLNPVFVRRFTDEFNARRNSPASFDFLIFLSVLLTGLLTITFYLLGWARGEINHRSMLVLLGMMFLFWIASRIFSGAWERTLVRLDFDLTEVGNQLVRHLGAAADLLLLPLCLAIILALLWSVGLALARRSNPARAASFAQLLGGRLLSKFVASRIGIGLLLGGIFGVTPYLITASGLFTDMEPQPPSATLFTSFAPALASLLRPISYSLFALYGFLLPLFNFFIRAPRISRLLVLLVGCLWLGDSALHEPTFAGALFVGGLLIVIADQIYWRYDFLTLLFAGLAADIAIAALSLTAQPSEMLRASGWRALGGLGALLIATLVVGWKGREIRSDDELEVAPLNINPALQRAERERLVAEFGVAREAQQHMLPSAPPVIPGYQIAATCRPAREVGGDLYDFLTLPNERVGIVVADVSGKGVPAALYMTLTKGLLASIAESESDPSVILCEVNRHLYEVCRRKVFVTMILGVLDPATRTLTYARAGHNPGVWRSATSQTLTTMRAPGLGLGLDKGKVFNQNLRQESIKVNRDDVLLFYSDGITEAMNERGEEFGEERLLDAIARADDLSADETRDVILAEVSEFLGGTPPQDDMTLVVVRVAEY